MRPHVQDPLAGQLDDPVEQGAAEAAPPERGVHHELGRGVVPVDVPVDVVARVADQGVTVAQDDVLTAGGTPVPEPQLGLLGEGAHAVGVVCRVEQGEDLGDVDGGCLLYTSPSPRD